MAYRHSLFFFRSVDKHLTSGKQYEKVDNLGALLGSADLVKFVRSALVKQ